MVKTRTIEEVENFINDKLKIDLENLEKALVTMLTLENVIGDKQNLTKITWSHATNSQKLLLEVLESDINFIEADIVYGYLEDDDLRLERQPIMAHPPDEESDLTLKSFLSQIWNFNEKSSKNNQKGIKLDFKSTDVFRNSLQILNEMWNPNYSIWLNADIYSGPVNNTSTQPVDPDFFLSESKKFPNATLSTGFTTKWGTSYIEGIYDTQQVNNMIDGLKKHKIQSAITFPVRAGIAAYSVETLSDLYKALNDTNVVTFTIWSSENDYVNIEELRKMIFHFGVDKVYIDVPNHIYDKLRLDIVPGNNTNSLKLNFLVGFISILIGFVFMRIFF